MDSFERNALVSLRGNFRYYFSFTANQYAFSFEDAIYFFVRDENKGREKDTLSSICDFLFFRILFLDEMGCSGTHQSVHAWCDTACSECAAY